MSTVEISKLDWRGLAKLGREMALSLSHDEMLAIQSYFTKLGREPTYVELNTIAQTWSEHCVHKTFRGIVETPDGKIEDGLFKTFIKKATDEIGAKWCVSVFEDNAGIVEFDPEFDVAFKVETHNHPTALDPYGGAGTGSGGVFRDIMGVGAKPILSTDILFFGPPDHPFDKLPDGVMHPQRVLKGAVAGIRDYGNRMGIPTANGAIFFDEGYLFNPLVYAGCVGVLPKGRYVKKHAAGDLIVLAGGRTGRDGIHGVTFASASLDGESAKTSGGAVQIGNAIEEKKVLDALLAARDCYLKGPLYSAVTDCGGGGLSSAIGEMARGLGAVVNLEKVPLKYAGLEPWEIWISESQERMIFAVPPKNLEKFMELFRLENCEAAVIGEFTGTGRLEILHSGSRIADLELDFLHGGVPRISRKASFQRAAKNGTVRIPEKNDYTQDLYAILSMPGVASKEWVIRQYDHEVGARTVIKPLHGAGVGPGDACVIRPRYDGWAGIVVSNGFNPNYSCDPYRMALSAIDEAIRNNVACGGRRIALLDNFSWGNPEKEDQLGSLVEACKGCRDGAVGFGTPFISGKDSLYNEYDGTPIPPTLVISALGIIQDVRRAVTMDLKKAGSCLYLLGETKDEMGGSLYHRLNSVSGGAVPNVELEKARKLMESLTGAIDAGLVLSCHDCSEGGLAVAVAEMSFAGCLGAELHLDMLPGSLGDCKALFSESNSRFILEIERSKVPDFEKRMSGNSFVRIGEVMGSRQLEIFGMDGKRKVLDAGTGKLREAWSKWSETW